MARKVRRTLARSMLLTIRFSFAMFAAFAIVLWLAACWLTEEE